MKNLKSLLAALLAVCMVATLLVGTVSAENGLDYAQGTTLRMATGYNNAKTGLFFNAEVAGEGITLAESFQYSNSLAAELPWYLSSKVTPRTFWTSTQVGFRSPL